jgi:hypothetical protein
MKRTLLFALALIVILPIALEAQHPETLTVSEFMEMEEAERNAFSSFVIGMVLSSTEAVFEPVRDCIEKWINGSPPGQDGRTHWLSSLSGWMSAAAGMADLGLVDPEDRNLLVMRVLIEAIPATCASP